jgi:transposase InsO family protein
VVAALVGSDLGAATLACVSGGSLVAAAPLSAAAAGGRAGANLCRQTPHGLGTAADRGRDRSCARDRLAALRRAGISRPPKQPREQSRRYEWPCPGDLLHLDTKRFVRFSRPGHAVTGDRHRTGAELRMRVGFEWVHSIVDDHSRYAFSELHRDEKAATVTGFLERALADFANHGIESKRLMSDNAWTYTHNRALAELLADRGIRHLLIPPRRPQVNGKVERYQQTLKREWALGQVYRSSEHRAQALSHWVSYYNERRPHSSLGGRPPISRVHNVPRQDT